jgi:hypothetical protein|tara:strand:+ start:2010 stop:2192 length:183 start_codon:yes stop_codon:yes gene_type:complete
MSKDIKEMFVEVAEKAVKEDKVVGENSLLSRVLATNIDHYKLCPFRSLNVDDCPLCKIGK